MPTDPIVGDALWLERSSWPAARSVRALQAPLTSTADSHNSVLSALGPTASQNG